MEPQSYIARVSINEICREPFRVFFPLGIVCTLISVSHWVLFYLGRTDTYPGYAHGLLQIQGFLTCFAIGFMMTVIPNFFEVEAATLRELLLTLFTTMIMISLLVLQQWKAAQIAFLMTLLALMVFAGRRFLSRQGNPPLPAIYLPIGLLHALLGTMFILLPWDEAPRWGEKMIEQGIFLCLIMGIGSFLGPRLLRPTQGMITPASLKAQSVSTPSRRRSYLLLGFLVLLSFPLEALVHHTLGLTLRAGAVSFQLFYFAQLHRLPNRRLVHVYTLWIGFLCVPLGLWLAAFLPAYELACLHVTFIGGFGGLALMIGMRVTLAHGGRPEMWNGNRLTTVALCAGLLLSLALRLLAHVFPGWYLLLLAASACCWDIAIMLWAIYVVPKLFSAPRTLTI